MKVSKWFVAVAVLFVTSLLTANIIAVKLVSIWGFILPAGVVIFPISYIFGDVLTEVYGYKLTRFVIWLGFAANVIMVAAIWLAMVLPPAGFWESQSAFESILGYTPRLLMASFLAYLFGEFANSYILARLKIRTQGKWLWLRTISSTIVGQGLDSIVFILVAFVGSIPAASLMNTILSQWIFKSSYEIIATPLTYAVVNRLKQLEGIDTYDHDTNFNPLTITN